METRPSSNPVEHFALVLSRFCMARCAHCGSSAGPDQTARLPVELARRVLTEAAVAGVDDVMFTGGEPMAHRATALEVIAHARAVGLTTSVCTNAFWATDAAHAAQTVALLVDAGLHRLQLSTDRWHLPFVPVERVHHARRAAVAAGLETQVAIPAGRRDWIALGLLSELSVHDGVAVFTHPAHPVGRGEQLPASQLVDAPPRPGGCGIAGHLEVDHDGRMSVCPTSADYDNSSALRLGDTNTEPVGALLDRYRRTPLYAVLRIHGPLALAELAGLGHAASAERHDCHACRLVVTAVDLAARLRDHSGIDLLTPHEPVAFAATMDEVAERLARTSPVGTRVALRPSKVGA